MWKYILFRKINIICVIGETVAFVNSYDLVNCTGHNNTIVNTARCHDIIIVGPISRCNNAARTPNEKAHKTFLNN